MAQTYITDLFNFQSSRSFSLRSVQNNEMVIPKHNTESFRHGPFDFQGGGGRGGLGILVRAENFFSDKIGARLFFSPALWAGLFFS